MTESSGLPSRRRALLAGAVIVLGGALLGVLGGVIWAAIAPRALFEVVSKGAADLVNPESSAFIAADGWFCLIALVGGAVLGLLGYVFAIRRYGASAMLAVLAGSVAAAFVTRLVGQQFGVSNFNTVLLTRKPGTLVHAPITLGAGGAIAFWPLAAGVVAGGIELIVVLRERRRHAALAAGQGLSSGPRHAAPRPGPADGMQPGQRDW
jgi:hypothetical protein